MSETPTTASNSEDTMTQPQWQPGEFHTRDGLTFRRNDDGTVSVRVRPVDMDTPPVLDVTLSEAEWESVLIETSWGAARDGTEPTGDADFCEHCDGGMDENDVLQVLCRVFDDGADVAMDEWREWYKPEQWLGRARAVGAFIRGRVERLAGEPTP